MDPSLASCILLLLGICMGALIVSAGYQAELRRIARFVRERDPQSNARVSSGAMPGVTDLADAVNAELDRSAEAHVRDMRHQQEFQRDLSALSHDIRTPLTGAKGYLQLACEEDDVAVRARHLDMASQRIDATTELLDQLFSYTKSTDPDLTLECEPVSLKPLVEAVLLGQYPAFEERGWEPVVMLANEGATVEADHDALERILQNLVVNALRHGAGAPTVMERMGEDGIELAISNPVDDPSALDASRLFERFYRADATRRGAGSGLGLAVAANLAHAMGMELAAALSDNNLVITLTMRRI